MKERKKVIKGLDPDKGKYFKPTGSIYFDDMDWFRIEHNIPHHIWYDYDGEFGEWLRDCDIRWTQNGLPLVDDNGKWIEDNEPPLLPREEEALNKALESLERMKDEPPFEPPF